MPAPNTATTDQVIAAAARLGFTVSEPFAPYRGARQLVLERRDVAGCVWVGVRSGRVLRASLTDFARRGGLRTRRVTGARGTRALLLLMSANRPDPADVELAC